ncbi:hypothetical protein K3G63_09645 [Hymenobacter sp. HSC-4F20]|uniref:hypothetical protein n=1 Tax=Hymenobacter sp. HSC-4F20 TaxID=2864135 RepID=UPI001C734875|nr:hypothetical protein [Hymenobacter sp. HSC-4F20]MBX0290701.1 hypothetical protein [Hymenobacter sp. HSC-4F20]
MSSFHAAGQVQLYFENPVGRLLEHPSGYLVVQYGAGKRKFEDMQVYLTKARELLQRRGWYKVLGDQRNMTAFTQEERSWITENWLNKAASPGQPYYGAVLLSHDVFARLSMNLVMNEARESGLVYRLFEDEAAADAWLRQLS